ncbi:MAG: SRPBCC family protein [Asticcacaulis sp.]|nr:SRPBCC family protein [Asticcacaulis sp.]
MAERSQDELGPPERPIGDHILKGILWGTLSGWLIVFVPYLIVLILKSRGLSHLWAGLPTEGSSLIYVYNVSLLLVMPLIQGLFGGVVRGREKQAVGSGIVVIAAITAVDIFVAFVFLREGGICILMASPLLAAILAIGYVIGRRLARVRRSRKVSMSLIPLVVVAVIGETTGPAPNYPAVVTDEVTVNAPPEYVWRYIVDYPDNPNPPKYWLWQMGLPAPTHSVAHVQEVDARRDCKFSGSQVFEERIAVLEPNKKLVFDITKQPDHPEIIGHISVDRGEMVLRENADHSTTIVATSYYRLHVRPAPYFAWWAEDVTRHIHFRVMGYMKTLAERDYQADKGK